MFVIRVRLYAHPVVPLQVINTIFESSICVISFDYSAVPLQPSQKIPMHIAYCAYCPLQCVR